jgi:superfamily I DNA/RNA helicase
VGEELALARRQLYVAMTRARERLMLSASEGPPSRLLAELGLDDEEPAP